MNFNRPVIMPEWNAGSMADIAFLMLTFFMITTQFSNEKGLPLVLPRSIDSEIVPIHKRNIFSQQINAMDQFMIQGEIRSGLVGMREEIKSFVLNYGQNPDLSDHPEKAIVSLKSDRFTTHKTYIQVLDEIQGAYYELYASQAGVDVDRFRKLDLTNPADRIVYDKGKKGIPMNISIVDSK